MRTPIILVLTVVLFDAAIASEFLRNLPDSAFVNSVTHERFKNSDAVIILKEQVHTLKYSTFDLGGGDLLTTSTIRSTVLIVKLFTDSAVRRYNAYEYSFPVQKTHSSSDDGTLTTRIAKQLPTSFKGRARIMKPDGAVAELDPDSIVVSDIGMRVDNSEVMRKARFSLATLVAGDVLQIEYEINEPATFDPSGLFFFNDIYPVLYSNLYITLPRKIEARFVSAPQERVGEPKLEQMSTEEGSGLTRFWGLKNLQGMPEEPFAGPLADRTMLTAFIIDKYEGLYTDQFLGRDSQGGLMAHSLSDISFVGHHFPRTWDHVAADFYKFLEAGGDINESLVATLGLPARDDTPTFPGVNALYSAIRKHFSLDSYPSAYPSTTAVSRIVEGRAGNASDLSYIMLRILKKRKVNAVPVLIRDRREGACEMSMPMMDWFTRLGLLVSIAGEERLYDFDPSIPVQYETPWFLKGISVMAIDGGKAVHKRMASFALGEKSEYRESHILRVPGTESGCDTMSLSLHGSQATHYRGLWHSLQPEGVNDAIRIMMQTDALKSVSTISANDFRAESVLAIKATGEPKRGFRFAGEQILFKPCSHLLAALGRSFQSAYRTEDIVFNKPFRIVAGWDLPIPPGYVPFVARPARSVTGPRNVKFTIMAESSAQRVTVNAVCDFPGEAIPLSGYAQFRAFLQSAIDACEEDVVFQKK